MELRPNVGSLWLVAALLTGACGESAPAPTSGEVEEGGESTVCIFGIADGEVELEVDPAGAVTRRQLRIAGQVFEAHYTRDPEGRPTRIVEGPPDALQTFELRYEGHRGRATTGPTSRLIEYDPATRTVTNRLETTDGAAPFFETCTFDDEGRFTRHLAPGERSLRFIDGEEIEEVGPDELTAIPYDARGRVSGTFSGVTVRWLSDEQLELSSGGQLRTLPAACEVAILPPCAWLWVDPTR